MPCPQSGATFLGIEKSEIDEAIRKQLDHIAHATFLGNATVPAIELAELLIDLAPGRLNRVFYSDSGSTAVEVALKIALQYWQQTSKEGGTTRRRFATISNAYHGDTVGAVSLGGIDLFHARHGGLLTRFNYLRRMHTAVICPAVLKNVPIDNASILRFAAFRRQVQSWAALFVEPAVQGAAGMLVQPLGYLQAICQAAKEVGALVILTKLLLVLVVPGRPCCRERKDRSRYSLPRERNYWRVLATRCDLDDRGNFRSVLRVTLPRAAHFFMGIHTRGTRLPRLLLSQRST